MWVETVLRNKTTTNSRNCCTPLIGRFRNDDVIVIYTAYTVAPTANFPLSHRHTDK
jgi:hypothetical protein